MTPRPIPDPGPVPDVTVALRMAEEGQFDQALAWLERELLDAGSPDDRGRCAQALAEIGRHAEQAGQFEVALRSLERACHVAPGWADLHYRRSLLLASRGRRTEARFALEQALEINPRYRAARVERALLDAREGRLAASLDALRHMAGDARPGQEAIVEQGLRALSEAAFDEAAPLLRSSLASGDQRFEEYLQRFQELMGRGERLLAVQVLRAAVQDYPRYPDLHMLLGVHELERGATDDAIESLSTALELNPNFHAARLQLARALAAAGQTLQALDLLDALLGTQPDHAEAGELRVSLASPRRVAPRDSARAREAS